jgi:hypothetical protein
MKIYTVNFGDISVAVRMNKKTVIQREYNEYAGLLYETAASQYDGGKHNFNGLKGAVVNRAVTKLFGKNCFWFGNCDRLNYGQVFESLIPSENDSSPENIARTDFIIISCTYRKKKKEKMKYLF